MADILSADAAKLKFRIMRNMLSKKGDVKRAHEDMRNCTNYVFRKIYMTLMQTAGNIKMSHQRAIVADLGAWLLWTIYKDTAYNPITLYIVKQLLKDDVLIQRIKNDGVDDIDDLYVNRWANTLENTAKMHKDDKISRFDLSESEQIFVPNVQHAKHKKLSEDELNNMVDNKVKKHIRKR